MEALTLPVMDHEDVGFAQMGMDLSGSIPLDAATVLTSLVIGTGREHRGSFLPARQGA